MMEIVTWLAVIMLGPGSIGIFIWFAVTLRSGQRDESTMTVDTSEDPR